MIKLMQILNYLKAQGKDLNTVMAELVEIVDNGRSEYFELSENDCHRISLIYFDEEKFNSVMKLCGF